MGVRQLFTDFANAVLRFCLLNAWFWIALLVVFVLVAAGLISIMHWDWLKDEESASTTIRNLGLVIAAIVALPLAIWRSIVAERQAATAQRQSETAQHGLLNERYQKGAEMLGSEVLAVRLGGIYALERLAREHPGDYHTQIMRLLCAFARNPPVVEKETQDTKLRADLQALLEAISTRSEEQIEIEKKEKYILELSGSSLEEASLSDGNLSGLFLFDVSLKGAFLYGTNLRGANLHRASLEGADLSNANLEGAWLEGVNLTGAEMRGCRDLTQEQLDEAVAREDNPPDLSGTVDAKTGKPLVWRGASPSR